MFFNNNIGLYATIPSLMSTFDFSLEKQDKIINYKSKILSSYFSSTATMYKIVFYQYNLEKYIGESCYLYIGYLFQNNGYPTSDITYSNFMDTAIVFVKSRNISSILEESPWYTASIVQISETLPRLLSSDESVAFFKPLLGSTNYIDTTFLYDLKDINEVLFTKGSGGGITEIAPLTINLGSDTYVFDGTSPVEIDISNAEGVLF